MAPGLNPVRFQAPLLRASPGRRARENCSHADDSRHSPRGFRVSPQHWAPPRGACQEQELRVVRAEPIRAGTRRGAGVTGSARRLPPREHDVGFHLSAASGRPSQSAAAGMGTRPAWGRGRERWQGAFWERSHVQDPDRVWRESLCPHDTRQTAVQLAKCRRCPPTQVGGERWGDGP